MLLLNKLLCYPRYPLLSFSSKVVQESAEQVIVDGSGATGPVQHAGRSWEAATDRRSSALAK